MADIAERGYSDSEVLVSTDWVAENLSSPKIRLVESNEDVLLYKSGHIPGAVEIDWVKDLNDMLRRDYLQREQFAELMSSKGIDNDTTVVFYGDKNNWWATYAFWVFKLFGHKNAKIMDGGRIKWAKEGRPMERSETKYGSTDYSAPVRDDRSQRIFRDGVLDHVKNKRRLIDVRSPEEYRGERLHMEGYPNEGALRGGHIPGATSIPWAQAINPDDGTFKTASELQDIYTKRNGFKPSDEIVVYCRIGERSSHTWFVLNYLLGFDNVRNYDGSWTEWGNLVGAPIEK
jgi:thiosulfate/3-mercaptopyruvate sulfurtransferase